LSRFSIVTISFNSEATIERTIKSVVNQNFDDYEFLIIDGGSEDNTMTIVNKYRDNIDVIISEKDNGISDAFNKGIRIAKGEYILLLNSDDQLINGVLEKIDSIVKDDTDILHTDLIVVDDNGNRRIQKPILDYERLLKRNMVLNHPGMFIAKSAYEKYGLYDTSFKCAMDRELVSRMYKLGAKFQYEDIETVVFQLGGESTRNFIKHAIPEGRRISISNGVPRFQADIYAIKLCFATIINNIKNKS